MMPIVEKCDANGLLISIPILLDSIYTYYPYTHCNYSIYFYVEVNSIYIPFMLTFFLE